MFKPLGSQLLRLFLILPLFFFSFQWVGCISSENHSQYKESLPRFYIEAFDNEIGSNKTLSIQLPVSESIIAIKPVPSIPEFDIEGVKKAEDSRGCFLIFSLTNKARLQLMQLCDEYRGRRLILSLGYESIGSWRIDRILTNGTIAIFVEVDDSELPELVNRINQALMYVQ